MSVINYIGRDFIYGDKNFLVSALDDKHYTCMELRKTNEENLYNDDPLKKPLVDGPNSFIRLHINELAKLLEAGDSNT